MKNHRKTTNIIADALNFEINNDSYKDLVLGKNLLKLFNIKKVPPLFPRVEEPLMEEAPKAMPDDKPNDKMKEEYDFTDAELAAIDCVVLSIFASA